MLGKAEFPAMTPPAPPSSAPAGAALVARNIEALLARRKEAEQRQGLQQRMADRITQFTGSLTFVYLHLVIFGVWIGINVGWLPFVRAFDPSLVILAMAASVEAIFLSTFVLISQNRMQQLADERADLNLHISLLAEHEITRLIQLVSAMAARQGIEEANNPELRELAQDIRPEHVIEEIESRERPSATPA